MRIVIVSDLHAGSEVGLTPFPANPIQRQLYNRWADCIEHFGGKPDILICNGDAVDGTQDKGAGDGDVDIPHKQVHWAATLLKMWKAKRTILVAGTHYHTGQGKRTDFEAMLATVLGCEYYRKLNICVNGWYRLQCRHKIGSSSVPYSRATAPARSKMWGMLNASLSGGKPPHLSVFSHVHYWGYAEDAFGATMTVPAWQAIGGLYGDTACDGHVDIGAVQIRVESTEAGGWSWQKRLYPAAVVNRTVNA